MTHNTLTLYELEQFDTRANTTGIERRFCCPLCGNDKPMDTAHRSLCVNTESGAWNCKRCGATGKLKEYWEDKGALIITSKQRRSNATQRIFNGQPKQVKEINPDTVKGFELQIKGIKPLAGTPAEDYLLSRGIPSELAKEAKCKYATNWGHSDKWNGQPAVIFPICDNSGKTIAATGRAIKVNTTLKQQTYGPKQLGVFITPGALEADPVAIVEAPICALSFALAGLPAIALCGKTWPDWLITCLAKRVTAYKTRTVYIALDADEVGDTAAEKLEDQLSLVYSERLRPQGAKDWNAILTEQSLDALRIQIPKIDKTEEYTSFTVKASEKAYNAVKTQSVCNDCGASVELNEYSNDDKWFWYECASCGNNKTVNLSNPEAVSEDPEDDIFSKCNPIKRPTIEADPEEDKGLIKRLADYIRESLKGRPLPIRIQSGEQVINIDKYAEAAALYTVCKHSNLSGPVIHRLKLLGIDPEAILQD